MFYDSGFELHLKLRYYPLSVNLKALAAFIKMGYNSVTMDFAVIKTGGKQYKVTAGDTLKIEKIKGEYKVGDAIAFEEVLLKDIAGSAEIGTPIVKGASVKATITEIGKLEKVMVVRYRQKSRYHKRNGHRQPFMAVKIESIA